MKIKGNLALAVVFTLLCSLALLPPKSFAAESSEDKSNKVIQPAPPAPEFTVEERHAELSKRRRQIAESLADNSVLILFSADSKLYTNDVDYVYRQENNLYYLTSIKQNGATLVLMKNGGDVREVLFLPKRNPQYETWNGRMLSNEDAVRFSGIDTIVDAKFTNEFLEALKNRQPFSLADKSFSNSFIPKHVYLLLGNEREFDKEKKFAESLAGFETRNALPFFARLRLVKSPYEVKLMRHSIAITNEALMRAMGMIDQAAWEYEVQAEVEYTFRRRNADFWGYPSIVGCGPNATTLHYTESQGKINKSDLILMDVGAEYEHYTADITRTFPVSGKFTKEQAEIYRIVYDAQEAAAAKLKPGATIGEASAAARAVINEGLFKLGLITDKNSNQYAMWYMHGWGHWLGMNVHDVGNYGTPLREGMITTNEPGIYIREDALDYLPDTEESRKFIAKVRPVFEKYKNIGVRIEDDMLITSSGVEWLSRDLPRKLEDVENFMAKAKTEMSRSARNPVSPGNSQRLTRAFFGTELNYGNVENFAFQNFLSGNTLKSGWRENNSSGKQFLTKEIHAH